MIELLDVKVEKEKNDDPIQLLQGMTKENPTHTQTHAIT